MLDPPARPIRRGKRQRISRPLSMRLAMIRLPGGWALCTKPRLVRSPDESASVSRGTRCEISELMTRPRAADDCSKSCADSTEDRSGWQHHRFLAPSHRRGVTRRERHSQCSGNRARHQGDQGTLPSTRPHTLNLGKRRCCQLNRTRRLHHQSNEIGSRASQSA
jgi:hypothetical protein